MSANKSTFEFGLGLGVSHNLSKLLGGVGCFQATQLEMESVKNIIDDSTAREVAARVLELANMEPPVLKIEEDIQALHYSHGEDGFGVAYSQPSIVTGPYRTPDLVGVPEDSDHLFASNRTDIVRRQ